MDNGTGVLFFQSVALGQQKWTSQFPWLSASVAWRETCGMCPNLTKLWNDIQNYTIYNPGTRNIRELKWLAINWISLFRKWLEITQASIRTLLFGVRYQSSIVGISSIPWKKRGIMRVRRSVQDDFIKQKSPTLRVYSARVDQLLLLTYHRWRGPSTQ